MRAPRLVAAVILVLVAVAPAAGAAVRKPLCKQLSDPDNDGTYLRPEVGQDPPAALEVLSADIATGRKNLVATLRTKTLQRDEKLTAGLTYNWLFTLGGISQELVLFVYRDGETQALYDADSKNGVSRDAITVTVVADPVASTITWIVPRKLVVGLKKGGRFSAMSASARPGSNIWTPAGSVMRGTAGSGDVVETTRTYTDLTPTCLKGT